MKRFLWKGLSCLLVLSLLVCGLVSCKSTAQKINELEGWEHFRELMLQVEKTEETIDSYTMEGELRFHGLVSDVGTDITTESVASVSGLLEGEYADLRVQESFMEIPDADFEQTITYTEGFSDGKAFRIYDADGKGQRIWSEMTSTDYRAYALEKSADLAMDISLLTEETATVSYEYEKGEGWTVTVEDIDDSVMDVYMTFLGFDELVEYENPETMTIVFAIDDDFYKQSLKLEAVYEKEGFQDATTITMEVAYKDYNATEVESVDLDDCTEVSDLRLIYRFEKLLKEMQTAKEGSFLVRHSVWADYGGAYDSDSEDATVSFREDDEGNYSYTLDSGTSTIERKNVDKKQRAKIHALIDRIDFIGRAAYYVSDIRIVEGFYYEFVLTDVAPSNLASIQQSLGTEEYTSEATLMFKVQDEKLIEYRCELELELEGKYGTFEFGSSTYYEADPETED